MTTSATPDEQAAPLVVRTVAAGPRPRDPAPGPASLAPRLRPGARDLAAPRRGPGRLGRGRPDPDLGCRPVRRRRQVVAGRPRRAVVRDEVDEPGTGLVCFGSFGFADEPGESRADGPRGRRRPARRPDLVDHRLTRRPGPARPARDDRRRRPAAAAGQVSLRRRRAQRRAVDGRGRRRRRTDQRRRAGEGRAGPRPGRHRRRAARRPLAAAPAGARLPDVLDLPRRRPVRGDAGAAGPPRARPGHLPGAGRHHPAYRRRRRATWPSPPPWPGRRRTSRSTSTPSGRSPTRWTRTARR